MEDIDVIGKFWLPGQQDDKEFGRLRFTRQSGGELEIYSDDSSSSGLVNVTPNDRKEDLLILGTSIFDFKKNQTTSRIFTLDRGMQTRSSISFGGISTLSTRFYIHSIYENMLCPKSEELTFSEATVQIHGINGWIPLTKEVKDISNIEATENQYIEPKSHKAEINNIGSIEICIPQYSTRDMLQDTYPATTIKLSFNKPSPISEILEIIGYIQNLVSLATSEFHSIELLTLRVPANSNITVYPQASETVKVFSKLYEPTNLNHVKENSVTYREHVCRFSYNDIGKAVGIAQWIERMNSSEGKKSLALSMLLVDKVWDKIPQELRQFSVTTAALILAPASCKKPIKERLQSLRNGLENVLPPYIDNKWFAAVAHLRSKFIAHPERRRGQNYPAIEAEFSRYLLKRVCYSRIFKDILELSDQIIKKKTWESNEAKQYLALVMKNDLKEWYRSQKAGGQETVG